MSSTILTLTEEFKEGQDGGYLSAVNPQFKLTVPKACKVTIKQKLEKVEKDWGKCCIFGVYDSGDLKGECITSLKGGKVKEIGKSKFLSSSSVQMDIDLPSAGSYTILCCSPTHSPKDSGVEENAHIHPGPMTLTVSNAPTGAKLVKAESVGRTLRKTLAFKGPGCAGYGSGKNPQFFLTVKQKVDVNVTMTVSNPTPKVAVKIFLQELKGDNKPNVRLHQFDESGQSGVFHSSSYLASGSVSLAVEKLEPGCYAILTMTNNKEPREVTVDVLVKGDPNCSLGGEEYPATKELKEDTFSSLLQQGKTTKEIERIQSPITYAYSVEDARNIVDKVTAKCKQMSSESEAHVFSDPDFLHNERSINESTTGKTVGVGERTRWNRLHEIVERPSLFTAGIEASDIAQGSLGNCWFCAVVSAIATRPDKITKLFYPSAYNPAGIYSINVWNGAEWFAILVDDALPCGESGMQCFARGVDKSEFWFPLVEKVAAKLVRSYQMLMGRNSSLGSIRVMELFTGGKACVLRANPNDVKWFPTLKEYLGKGWICSTGSEPGCCNGIVSGHAYTPLTVYESADEKLQLIRVRNTWGHGEWKGAYHDHDPIWDKNPALAKACDMDRGAIEDGIFWMTRKDFEDNFETLNFCAFPSDGLKNEKSLEKLSFNSPESTRKPRIDILAHDQVLFTCPGGTEVNIRVRFSGSKARASSHHFYLFGIDDIIDEGPTHNLGLPVDDAHFISQSMKGECTGQVKLPASSCGKFIIVPCQSHGCSDEADSPAYSVVIQSTAPVDTMKKLLAAFSTTTQYTLKEDATYSSKDAPCFQITVSKACKSAFITCVREGKEAGTAMQIVVGSVVDVDTIPSHGNIFDQSKYLSSSAVTINFGSKSATSTLPAGTFMVWMRIKNGTKGENITIKTGSDQHLTVAALR